MKRDISRHYDRSEKERLGVMGKLRAKLQNVHVHLERRVVEWEEEQCMSNCGHFLL